MHLPRLLAVAGILLLAACNSDAGTRATSPAAAGTVVTMQRTTCFGPCPAYRVSLADDGQVTFTGIAFVQTKGTVSARATPAQVAAIRRAIDAADLRGLRNHYTSRSDGCAPMMTDMKSVQITIGADAAGGSKTVDYSYGCRGALADQVRPRIEQLAGTIDQQLDTARWIGKPAPFSVRKAIP